MPPPGACPDPGIEPVSAALARIPSKWLDSGDRGHASFLIVEGTDSGFIIGRKKKRGVGSGERKKGRGGKERGRKDGGKEGRENERKK